MLSRLKFNLSQLANEMLDQLPEQVFISDSTTFYDPAMGGGQFLIEVVNRLRKYNHFDANISKRIFGSEENKLRVNYVKNLHKLPGEFRTELIEDMKFDVVIGNPPFQELDNNGRSKANSGSNLYGRFIDLGIKVLKENGYLSLISPIAWTGYDAKIGGIFRTKNIVYLNLNECAKHFKGIGSTFSYYIIQNSLKQGKTKYKSEFAGNVYEGNEILFNQIPFIPQLLSPLSLSIIDKVYNNNLPKYSYVRDNSLHSQKINISKNITPYKAFHFHYNNGFYSEHPHPKVGSKKKVLVGPGRLGLKQEFGFFDKNCEYHPTQNCIFSTVDTNQEGNYKLVFLRSKLVQFLLRIVETGSFWEKKMLTGIPYIEPTTEEDLYNILGLTQEEIDLIEKFIN